MHGRTKSTDTPHGAERPPARCRQGLRRLTPPLLWLSILLLAGTAVASLTLVCMDFVRSRAERSARMRLPRSTERQPEPMVFDPAADAETPATTDAEPEHLAMDWRSERRVRKAAALLLRHGDHEAAIQLLNHGRQADGTAFAIGRSLYERALQQRDDSVAQEFQKIREHWQDLTEDTKTAHFPAENETRRAAFERLLAADAPMAQLETAATVMPDSLSFCLAGNVHTALAEIPGCPDQILQLLLEPLYPAETLTEALRASRAAFERWPYPDAGRLLDRCFSRQILLPIVGAFFGERREQLQAADADVEEWCQTVFGTAFCQGLRGLAAAQPSELDMRLLWRELHDRIRAVWSSRFHLAVIDSRSFELPESLLKENYWLRHAQTEIDPKVLRFVYEHPHWRAHLRHFSYRAALKRLPEILEDLGALRFFDFFDQRLQDAVQEERGMFLDARFEWQRFRERLEVAEEVPLLLRGSAGSPTQARSGKGRLGKRWDDVQAEAFRSALTYLARLAASPEKQVYYNRLARVYALNRGLD